MALFGSAGKSNAVVNTTTGTDINFTPTVGVNPSFSLPTPENKISGSSSVSAVSIPPVYLIMTLGVLLWALRR